MGRLIRIEVVPVLRYGWLVYYGPNTGHFCDRKKEAVTHARLMAAILKAASIRIHDRHGRFQDERTLPRSADPKRSKG